MLNIYNASVDNVRDLKKSKTQANRLLSFLIKKKRTEYITTLTKNHILLYSMFAEASFFKMIFTPYGFESHEIDQIISKPTIDNKWMKCIDLAFDKIDTNDDHESQRKKTEIKDYVSRYILKPKGIRNKIAHGQSRTAFNRSITSINSEMSNKILTLDFVEIDRLFRIYEIIGQIVENIIESPNMAHNSQYDSLKSSLDEEIHRTRDWCLESRISIINTKIQKYQSSRS